MMIEQAVNNVYLKKVTTCETLLPAARPRGQPLCSLLFVTRQETEEAGEAKKGNYENFLHILMFEPVKSKHR